MRSFQCTGALVLPVSDDLTTPTSNTSTESQPRNQQEQNHHSPNTSLLSKCKCSVALSELGFIYLIWPFSLEGPRGRSLLPGGTGRDGSKVSLIRHDIHNRQFRYHKSTYKLYKWDYKHCVSTSSGFCGLSWASSTSTVADCRSLLTLLDMMLLIFKWESCNQQYQR